MGPVIISGCIDFVNNGILTSHFVFGSSDNFNEGIYIINKEIKEGGAVDLSNANFLEVGSLANLLDVFYEKCSEKVCGEDDLRNSLNIQEAKRRHEKRKDQLEELQESLERLKNLLD